MSNNQLNNKRIAKNTLLLYFRMLLLMAVSLYTSRVILHSLGVVDYGIYNVVGGVVAMFSLLSGSLSSSIIRFINVELGKGDIAKLTKVFSTAINIQVGLGLVVLVVAETIGLWFLNVKMIIPEDRLVAANCCYQLSLLTFFINLISVPYNASIVAHEKMSAFAYISIFEAVAKLVISFMILWNPLDRLIYYAVLLAIVAVSVRFLYGSYCSRNFVECRYSLIFDKKLIKEMYGFAGWNFIGSSAAVLRDQGGNVIINLFCGPTVNAARAIAVQVNNAVTGFISNFQMALNPQIMKNYANGNKDYMFQLVFQGTRLCYFILFILSLPIIVNTEYILGIWLGDYPEHSVIFVQLILIYSLSESLAGPLVTTMLATGKIRNYQLLVGGLQMLNLPIAYICLRCGMPPESVTIVAIILSVFCEAARLIMLRGMIGLPISAFLTQVYFKVILVTLIASIPPIIYILFVQKTSFVSFAISSIICLLSSILCIIYIGCNKQERELVKNRVIQVINRLYTEK